ncbi:MAG: Bax inhibitor-1/YccA family protein [Solirubrobacteraceae bacterium]
MGTYEPSAAFGTDALAERDFLRQVFAWMFLALALTTGVAIWFHSSHSAINYFSAHRTLFLVAILAQLAFVVALRPIVASQHVSVQVAALIFFLYAALTGVVFSILLDVYTTKSVVGAFGGACGVFAGMALWGYTTKSDLSRFGPILFGALMGVIVASVVFIFTGGGVLNLLIGFAGVIVFAGLTAYDIQNLKNMRMGRGWMGLGRFGGRGRSQAATIPTGVAGEKYAIYGALLLYLDFINLFIMMLRIFGGARR